MFFFNIFNKVIFDLAGKKRQRISYVLVKENHYNFYES